MSPDSARRPGTERFSTYVLGFLCCRSQARGPARRHPVAAAAVVLRLELLDQTLHLDGVPLAVPMAAYWARSSRAFYQHVREHQVAIDQHRSDVRDVHRVFAS